jgi:hypothetical protein
MIVALGSRLGGRGQARQALRSLAGVTTGVWRSEVVSSMEAVFLIDMWLSLPLDCSCEGGEPAQAPLSSTFSFTSHKVH